MNKWISVIMVFALGLFLQSCEREVVCEDDSYYIVENRCIKKDVNDITFIVPNGMDPIDKITVYNGETFTLPTLDIDFDYEWYEDDDFDVVFNPNVAVNKDTTVYLKVEGSYVFVYHLVGETPYDGLLGTEVYFTMPQTADLKDVSYTGYNASSWYTDEDLTTTYTSSFTPEDEDYTIDLFNELTKIPYTISYIAPDVLGDIEDDIVLYEEYLTFPVFDIDRGYKFYTDPEHTTQFNARTTQITEDKTIYIGLEDFEYYIYYQHGNSILDIVEYDDVDDLVHPVFERQGYDFMGWYLDKELTMPVEENEIVQDELHPFTKLYADYDIHMYNLNFVLNGELFVTIEYAYNEIITLFLPGDPYGDYLNGYYTDPELTTRFTDLYMPDSDLTLYGEFTYKYNVYDNLTDLIANAQQEQGQIVEVTGVVLASTRYTVYVSDGTDIVTINFAIDRGEDLVPGTKITVQSEFVYHIVLDNYESYTLDQPIKTEIISTDNPLPIDIVNGEISDFNVDEGQLRDIEGRHYLVTGTLGYNETLELYSISDDTFTVYFYERTLFPVTQLIKNHVGDTVTMPIFFYNLSYNYRIDGYVVEVGSNVTVDDLVVHEE